MARSEGSFERRPAMSRRLARQSAGSGFDSLAAKRPPGQTRQLAGTMGAEMRPAVMDRRRTDPAGARSSPHCGVGLAGNRSRPEGGSAHPGPCLGGHDDGPLSAVSSTRTSGTLRTQWAKAPGASTEIEPGITKPRAREVGPDLGVWVEPPVGNRTGDLLITRKNFVGASALYQRFW
jgi:hypothetical protein